ncbi:MAG: hypothetical protein AB8G05_10065 [Oligoflexales bacterium]
MYGIKKITLAVSLIMMTAIASAKTKYLVVGEKIISNNPWRNELIKGQYRFAVSEAMQAHKKKYPKSSLQLLESFDDGPNEGFELAEKRDALGVVGYLYSMDAFEASQVALKRKIPYLSPVSPLDSLKNSFAYSMANSHTQLLQKYKEIAQTKEFSNPSIVLLPETFLPNYEYEKLYRKAFKVTDTLKGNSSELWQKLEDQLKKSPENQIINVLFAGFAFEQMELAAMLSTGSYADRIKIIAHSQWYYCHKILGENFTKNSKNIYVVTDYFDVPVLPQIKEEPPTFSLAAYDSLNKILTSAPKIKGNSPEEPIVYVLRDMIAYALEVAENSKDRVEFGYKYGSGQYEGASGFYEFKDKVSTRKVYLGKWDNDRIKPIKKI